MKLIWTLLCRNSVCHGSPFEWLVLEPTCGLNPRMSIILKVNIWCCDVEVGYCNHTLCIFAGKGNLNIRDTNNDKTTKPHSGDIPSIDEAVHRIFAIGGHLSTFSPFGSDPMVYLPNLVVQRDAEYARCMPELSTVFMP